MNHNVLSDHLRPFGENEDPQKITMPSFGNDHKLSWFAGDDNDIDVLYYDGSMPFNQAQEKSKFYDLLVVNPQYKSPQKSSQFGFLLDIAITCECPVMILPHYLDWINEIVFICNGSASSLVALKKFNHLFSKMSDTKMTIIEMEYNSRGCDMEKIRVWANQHYQIVTYVPYPDKSIGAWTACSTYENDKLFLIDSSELSVLSNLLRKAESNGGIGFPIFINK